MKSKLSKKLKVGVYFSIVLLIFASLVAFVAVFFNKPLSMEATDQNPANNNTNSNDATNNKTNQQLDNDSDYTYIEIADTIVKQTNINLLTYYDTKQNCYYFGQNSFASNIFSIIEKALNLNPDFNDDFNNYAKTLKYQFENSYKSVTINLYMDSTYIKTKKYKSFFKLLIV
ncbi:MAG: hypothetical protein HUJ42_03565 [Malacoplasma sp.]|nr:hypothetical protein [Malacoplasma sp.]